MAMKQRVLITNDDGIESLGIARLAQVIAEIAEVWVVAPTSDRSGASHALTTRSPLRISKTDALDRPLTYVVDGTPSDCVYLALSHLMSSAPPALVLSGINSGFNLADDITYSGTVAAAVEAVLLDVPAIALSVGGFSGSGLDEAARLARALACHCLDHPDALPRGLFLNVNVPSDPRPGVFQVTTIGRRAYSRDVREGVDPRGRAFYWIGGDPLPHDDISGSDCNTVLDDGISSVTPVHVQSVDEASLANWRTVRLPNFKHGVRGG